MVDYVTLPEQGWRKHAVEESKHRIKYVILTFKVVVASSLLFQNDLAHVTPLWAILKRTEYGHYYQMQSSLHTAYSSTHLLGSTSSADAAAATPGVQSRWLTIFQAGGIGYVGRHLARIYPSAFIQWATGLAVFKPKLPPCRYFKVPLKGAKMPARGKPSAQRGESHYHETWSFPHLPASNKGLSKNYCGLITLKRA